jgi:uncharacterized protein (TIGR02231 family)
LKRETKNRELKQFNPMKKILFMLCLSLAALTSNAADEPKRLASKIREATVYINGAKLQSVAQVNLASGNSEIIFENLPIGINPASLQVRLKGSTSVSLLSAKFRSNYTESPAADAKILRGMRDSLTELGDRFTTFQAERDVLTGEQNLITQSLSRIGTGKDKDLTVKDLQDLADYYRTRLTAIKTRWQELAVLERKTREISNDIQQRYNEMSQKKGKTSGEIVLALNTNTAQSIEIACLYFVNDARWSPQYDLRADATDKPLRLVYKAAISQSCGLDWKDVKLKVSTANPNLSNNRPILNPQYLDFHQPIAYQVQSQQLNEVVVTGAPRSARKESTYNLAQVDAMSRSNMMEAKPVLETEVIDLEELTGQNSTETTAVFDVPMSHNIPTDGQQHFVQVQESDMKASYEYHAVPKMEQAVFLIAKVSDYGQYHLLPANANIFYQDTYIGQSFIDPRSVGDTLLLSLGRDENISIKRARPVDVKSEKKVLGDTKREVIEYEITVKNNKQIAIPIEILDQVPVSRQKELEIIVDEDKLSGAEYNKTYGKLLWRVTIGANSSKKIRFGYTLKYPKDKALAYQGQ